MPAFVEKTIVASPALHSSENFSPRFPLEGRVAGKLIELRAWQLWKEAGCPAGKDLDFWVRAENEILRLDRAIPPIVAATETLNRLSQSDSKPK